MVSSASGRHGRAATTTTVTAPSAGAAAARAHAMVRPLSAAAESARGQPSRWPTAPGAAESQL